MACLPGTKNLGPFDYHRQWRRGEEGFARLTPVVGFINILHLLLMALAKQALQSPAAHLSHAVFSKCISAVKNPFGLQDVLFQVFMTRQTLVVKRRRYIKVTFSDNRPAAFHSFIHQGK